VIGTPPPVTRFAPSPTGRLHLGHAFSAMRAHDLARAHGGRFLLRIEDIDPGRTREAYVAGILEDLEWLGLRWDGPVLRQSARLDVYAAALDRLRARDLIYPCTCTRAEIAAEIAASASAPQGKGPARYPGTCRTRAPIAGREAAWRLRMDRAVEAAGPLFWEDATLGRIAARAERDGDIVLARRDAPVSYALAATLDDAATGVTHVVRGLDLVPATDVQRLLQALLDLPTPMYHHHPLLADADGRRLAKREGAQSLADLRAGGADPRDLLDTLRAGRFPIVARAPAS
jgi:glutamyl-Q tRNA(Asp) synthetase